MVSCPIGRELNQYKRILPHEKYENSSEPGTIARSTCSRPHTNGSSSGNGDAFALPLTAAAAGAAAAAAPAAPAAHVVLKAFEAPAAAAAPAAADAVAAAGAAQPPAPCAP